MLESLLNYFCAYYRDSRLEYGWVEAIHKNKLIVVPQKGKNQYLPANRIALNWRGEKLAYNANQAHELLDQHLIIAAQFSEKLELETMHSLLNEVREYTLDEIAVDFLDDPTDSVCKLGMFMALREDSFWFKHNRNLTYTPRTEDELEALARQKERQQRANNIQQWINQLERGEWNSDSVISEEQQLWLDQLLNILIKASESPHWKEMSSLLDWGTTLGYNEEKSLKNWLAKAGSPVSPSRLTLLRADIRKQFPEEILAEVERVRNLPLEKLERFSADIPTFTIDAEKTRDYDDAFSVLEWSEEKLVIAVHITDLSGEDRIVLSFNLSISENGNWQLIDVVPQIIRVRENLSYEQAEKLIEEDYEYWGLLYKFCLLAHEKRIENGALNLARKEFEYDISNPDQIRIIPLNRNSASNRIIEELAIAVNRETGRLFDEVEMPGIFRTQSSYRIVKELEDENQQLPENIRVEPARLTTVAGTHAGLGCDAYMHVTSPIRRFVDLITQQQLKKLIKKEEPVFTSEDMMRWSEGITLRQRKYNRAEKIILQYWKFRYLQQNKQELFEAKVRKQLSNNNTEIELLELDCIVQVSGLRGYEEEEQIILKINEVSLDPLKLIVRAMKSVTEDVNVHRLEGKTA